MLLAVAQNVPFHIGVLVSDLPFSPPMLTRLEPLVMIGRFASVFFYFLYIAWAAQISPVYKRADWQATLCGAATGHGSSDAAGLLMFFFCWGVGALAEYRIPAHQRSYLLSVSQLTHIAIVLARVLVFIGRPCLTSGRKCVWGGGQSKGVHGPKLH